MGSKAGSTPQGVTTNLQHAREAGRFWRGFTLRESVDSKHSRRIPLIDLKNRRTFTLFTIYRVVAGKLAECSDKFAPIIGFWVQGLDKKNFLRRRSLVERKFQGKKPKSAMHLLLEKLSLIRKWGEWNEAVIKCKVAR